MKKLILILAILTGICFATDVSGQTGGKKRERSARKRGNYRLTQWKSRGHADDFARGNKGRKNIFTKYFKKDRPAWTYRPTGNPRSNFRANQFLFKRPRSKGKADNDMVQDRQNKERARNRVHGNSVFSKKKYRRK